MVSVNVGIEEPVDVGNLHSKHLQCRNQILLRLKMGRIYKYVLLPFHKDDTRPHRTERHFQKVGIRQDLLKLGILLEDLPR